MRHEGPPVACSEMMIPKPVSAVYTAFIDPAITPRFWFTGGSSKLEEGKSLAWTAPVEWNFTPRQDGTTMVSITASGFTANDEEQVAQAINSMGGFGLVLAGAKAFL